MMVLISLVLNWIRFIRRGAGFSSERMDGQGSCSFTAHVVEPYLGYGYHRDLLV